MTIDKKTVTVGLITLVAGMLLGWWIFGASSDSAPEEKHAHDTVEEVWTCSMHPQIRQNAPGKCPICGMDLILLENGMEDGLDPAAISMSPAAMQLANISTAIVGVTSAKKSISLYGKIQTDERRIYSQSSHIPGRIEKLNVNFTGEFVKKGQVLASLYSPELVNAQKELLEAYKIRDTQPQLYEASREKLRSWKFSEAQLEAVIESGAVREVFPVFADVSGYVTRKQVNLGDYLPKGKTLYEIADFSKVWVLLDVYETDLAWIKVGSPVSFTVESFPGETFKGKISYFDPVINPQSRVAKARVELDNKSLRFKPEMFVSALLTVGTAAQSSELTVPKSAVMWTGKRSVVYVKNTSHQTVSFLLREVTLGPALGKSYQITEGLEVGEEIAVNGTFSIDAAAQLAGKPSMMNRLADDKAGAFSHEHMIMLGEKEESAGASPLPVPASFRKELSSFLMAYIKVKEALVGDDSPQTSVAATRAKEELSKVDMKHLEDKQMHMSWMKLLSALQESLEKISSTTDMEAQRASFVQLSMSVVSAASQFGVEGTKFYQQHCPMADNNKGADWLSLDAEVKNPYYGDAMLSCGSVVQEFNPIK